MSIKKIDGREYFGLCRMFNFSPAGATSLSRQAVSFHPLDVKFIQINNHDKANFLTPVGYTGKLSYEAEVLAYLPGRPNGVQSEKTYNLGGAELLGLDLWSRCLEWAGNALREQGYGKEKELLRELAPNPKPLWVVIFRDRYHREEEYLALVSFDSVTAVWLDSSAIETQQNEEELDI